MIRQSDKCYRGNTLGSRGGNGMDGVGLGQEPQVSLHMRYFCNIRYKLR